jgi:hypothetical protein
LTKGDEMLKTTCKIIVLAWLACTLPIVVGCGSSGKLSQESLGRLQKGMTLQEVESILGTEKRQVDSRHLIDQFGPEGTTVYLWQEGTGFYRRTILVSFKDDELHLKAGSGHGIRDR